MDVLSISVRLHSFLTETAGRLRNLGSNEEGQTAAEYVGIIVAVGFIFAALAFSPVGQRLKEAFDTALDKILNPGQGG